MLERQANRAIGWLGSIFGLGDNDTSRAAIAMLDPPEPVELSPLDELEFRREVFATLLGDRTARSKHLRSAPTQSSIACSPTASGRAIRSIDDGGARAERRAFGKH